MINDFSFQLVIISYMYINKHVMNEKRLSACGYVYKSIIVFFL